MPFRRKQPQAVAEIRLDPPHSDAKAESSFWLTNETIHGHAVYTFPNGLEFTNSKVVLKGSVKTTTNETTNGRLQQSWRVEKFDILTASLDSKPRTGFKSDDGVVRIPFRFNLRDCEKGSPWITDLPPSLNSKEEGQRTADDQYNVTYSITATAFSKHGQAATTTTKVTIIPVVDQLPDDANVPGEYFVGEQFSQPTVGLRRSQSNLPRVHIAAQEPCPIVIDPDHLNAEAATQIPFVIKVSPPTTSAASSNLSRCELKTHLVTRDVLTPDGLSKTTSNGERTRYNGVTSVQQHKSQEQHSSLAIPGWGQFQSSPTEPFSLTRLSYLFRVKDGKAPLPTFSTPLLSRKYAIELSLSFPEISGYSWKLSLPLDVMYEGHDDNYEVDYVKRRKSTVSITEARL